jgi:hypothetical protein
METKTYGHHITVLRAEKGDTFLRHVKGLRIRLIDADDIRIIIFGLRRQGAGLLSLYMLYKSYQWY